MAGAKILIEDCTFNNFYSGIVVHKGAQVCVSKLFYELEYFQGSVNMISTTEINKIDCKSLSVFFLRNFYAKCTSVSMFPSVVTLLFTHNV